MDLSTTYLGIKLPHPFTAGAGPFADTADGARKLEDAGAAAITMRSLFEEQIDAEAMATHHSTEAHAESFSEALSYFAEPVDFVLGPDEYLDMLRRIKSAVDIPVFASLNGTTPGGWLSLAKSLADAGADGLELNLYYIATHPVESAAEIEERSVEVVRQVRTAISIPLSVKLSSFYTALPHFSARLEDAGADGLILFNRFFGSDVDIEELELRPHLKLSDPSELLLRLRWLAILSARLQKMTLAVSGGVHTLDDAVKALMSGASAVQSVSALLRHGVGRLTDLKTGLAEWLETNEYDSLGQMIGSMNMERCPNPVALTRANYMRTLQTWQGDEG